MHHPDERRSHRDHMQVRCGKRTAQLVQRQVRQARHIGQSMVSGKTLHLGMFAAATDEEEVQPSIRAQCERREHQRVQRMTRAVIAGIHDHELILDPMSITKGRTRSRIIADGIVVSPRCIDMNDLWAHSLVHQPRRHETVERDDPRGTSKAPILQLRHYALRKAASPQPAGSHRFIRVQIHHPRHYRAALQNCH